MTSHKYESDGGPSASDVVALLRRHGRPSGQRRNVERFTRSLIFNYLMGAPEAHAKNYSVLLIGDDVRLTPLYDVASGLPYLCLLYTSRTSSSACYCSRRMQSGVLLRLSAG